MNQNFTKKYLKVFQKSQYLYTDNQYSKDKS